MYEVQCLTWLAAATTFGHKAFYTNLPSRSTGNWLINPGATGKQDHYMCACVHEWICKNRSAMSKNSRHTSTQSFKLNGISIITTTSTTTITILWPLYRQ